MHDVLVYQWGLATFEVDWKREKGRSTQARVPCGFICGLSTRRDVSLVSIRVYTIGIQIFYLNPSMDLYGMDNVSLEYPSRYSGFSLLDTLSEDL